jgi:hypothetical protein
MKTPKSPLIFYFLLNRILISRQIITGNPAVFRVNEVKYHYEQ